ncbi:lactate racemase domain-containing protein [Natrialbaceae archaeon AArc-T1-2]|uniref:lactate racemase domain-containing protein n=1 Tax=Natrialbaceae archaeon AArc-T1-2 TaxID=3053904 RepID=UPI00255AB00E|nr:lactate racemase domain-containing protein [Natrialbaceae archaeon AArc-T1-2]WIV66345.1 lactate racemase domain-containing protein [Natrialbaceae archaeon AArc-T1-2]
MKLPLGERTIEVQLPTCTTTVAEPPGGTTVDVREAARAALETLHGPSLDDRVDADDEVVIVVTDLTRTVPDDVLLEVLLADLDRIGVGRGQITVVVGLGLHRPMTDEELEAMLGSHADLAVNHDPEAVVEVGTVDGVPIEIGEPVATADTVLSTGVVEPHQYAGFSGGAKTVVIGAGGESQIRYTHGPDVLAEEGVRLGRLEDNPFRSFLDRAGDRIGIDCCLNLTHGPEGVLGVSAGDGRSVVRELADVARNALSVPVDREYDAVVCGVGAPKDATLYQATRAATYVALGDRNPLAEGGRLVVPAELPEGAGEGTGEQRFYDRLVAANDADALYRELREGYEPGAQRAFVVARVLRDHDVVVTNSRTPEVVEACLMETADDVADALESGSDVLVVPDALNTLLVEG